jgi:hypothetical protein
VTKKGIRNDKRLKEAIAAMDERLNQERAKFRSVIESLRDAPPLQRAEGCLWFWAEKLYEWGDHEAVVYLISRGNDCSSIVRKIQSNWRDAEARAIEIAHGIADGRKTKFDPNIFLDRFWDSFDQQELSIDATILRTAQWCNIQGYEQWWKRQESELREAAFGGGVHLFALFNYCRADYAIREMGQALQLSLVARETLAFPKHKPLWWRSDGNLDCAIHDAAAFVFANARTRTSGKIPVLVDRAVDDLRKSFNHDCGAWPAFSGRPTELSVESTAMALHALKAVAAPDWNQFAAAAQNWLWLQQEKDGYWFENAAPDPVWLTVLVLDAIELTKGGTKLTFQFDATASASPLVFVAYQHDDTKWLDDLKRHLGALVHGGAIEFFDDRQIGGGHEWDAKIKEKLKAAGVIVLLLSPNFLGSKYIQTVEFPNAMAQHREGRVTVLPVLVEECNWQTLSWNGFSLGQLNVLPKDKKNNLKPLRAWGSKKHEALAAIAREIGQLISRAREG